MKRNSVLQADGRILRVLEVREGKCLVIDCKARTMPYWALKSDLEGLKEVSFPLASTEPDEEARKVMHQRFTMISAILPVVGEEPNRCSAIKKVSEEYHVSKQTVRKYLCDFLVYQNIEALAPVKRNKADKELSQDEKNMRWALNKFFYTTEKNTLKTAYTQMLKNKYCDSEGNLLEKYPSFYQFRYFYRKTRNMQNYYISRDGLKSYQRNNRPCTGDGVKEFAGNIGVGMLDATICDIYLVDNKGNVAGRPILTACIDTYSSLCCGYSLSWEGGVYSLRTLMLNVIADKKEHCEKFGIVIDKDIWPSEQMPGKLVTDMGTEYMSETFGQLTELGITITNLPPYRPELKGPVEKFFDLLQGYYKPYLKGKGLIEPDYQERGVHDYRKDACLTIEDFEKIILHCITFYNSQRILENFQYTEEMLRKSIKPYANEIWNYGLGQTGSNLMKISKEQLIMTLLPRTTGKFSRYGLKANKMRYHHENYVEKYLAEQSVTVAYNPDDVSFVWVIENGKYIRFELVESRFKGKALEGVQQMKDMQNNLKGDARNQKLQAEIDLANHIQTIAGGKASNNKSIKNIRGTRKKEQNRKHRDVMKEEILI